MVKLTDLCPATARIAGAIVRSVFDEAEVALFEGDVSVATALLELTVQPYLLHRQYAGRQGGDGGRRQAPGERHAGVGR